MVLGGLAVTCCPKCDCDVYARGRDELMEIDVVHGGEEWPEALTKIQRAISAALLGSYKGLKVVHGHGAADGHTSKLRPRVIAFLNEYARGHAGRVTRDRRNEGAHILYF